MNAEEIKNCLLLLFRQARINIPFYIFSANTMWKDISIKSYPILIIQNTDRENDPGRHWIAYVVLSRNNCEYWDSYGNPITMYKYVQQPTKYIIKENCLTLQSDHSYLCGVYCIYYVYHRALGFSYREILDSFSPNVILNDKKMCKFIHSITHMNNNHRFCSTSKYKKCQFNVCKSMCPDFY